MTVAMDRTGEQRARRTLCPGDVDAIGAQPGRGGGDNGARPRPVDQP
jgi:hypothetical protein